MSFWKRVHWFFTSNCNEKCGFCFKPKFDCGPEDKATELAKMLVDNGVKEVILTGGEPLLSRSLVPVLEVLHSGGVDTSIHTNATLLTPRRVGELTQIVDEIAIPIDSVDRQMQAYLRRRDCLPKVKSVLEKLRETPVRIGIHTVATAVNIEGIPKIYDFLKKGRFDYWRIYEFNPDLVADRFSSVARFREVERLGGKTAAEDDGGVNCLFADFLLMEERMSRHDDKRVQFVGIGDYDREPYFFLDSNGEVYFAVSFAQARKPIGNILTEGFREVGGRTRKEIAKGSFYDEKAFVESELTKPTFARLWLGDYDPEELENIHPKYFERFGHLAELNFARMKRQGYVPKDEELFY